MSVTCTGPEGYRYQHDATVWLVLAWRERKPIVRVESGLEDATFLVTVDGAQRMIEAQMKSERGPISEEKLAKWLAHFPPQGDTNSLLEQLRDRPDLSVVFLLADATTGIMADLCVSSPEEALLPRKTSPLTRAAARSILDAFGKVYEGSKPDSVDARRHVTCSALAKTMKDGVLREVARRIFVLSQHDQGFITERSAALLNKAFFVPQGQTHAVLRSLCDLVEEGVKSQSDVASRVYHEATRRGSRLIFRSTAHHVKRVEEDEFFEVLRTQNVLFLTGLPNAGKTHIGRALASAWQRQGYHADEGGEIDRARRFLGEVGPEERIFLLEDPFGQVYPSREASQTISFLRRLLGDVEEHRKLIITSRADILRSVVGDPPWIFEGHRVHDISLAEHELAVAIWENMRLASTGSLLEHTRR